MIIWRSSKLATARLNANTFSFRNNGMILRQPLDVRRIIEIAVPLDGNEPWIVLLQALQAASISRSHMRLPICSAHRPV